MPNRHGNDVWVTQPSIARDAQTRLPLCTACCRANAAIGLPANGQFNVCGLAASTRRSVALPRHPSRPRIRTSSNSHQPELWRLTQPSAPRVWCIRTRFLALRCDEHRSPPRRQRSVRRLGNSARPRRLRSGKRSSCNTRPLITVKPSRSSVLLNAHFVRGRLCFVLSTFTSSPIRTVSERGAFPPAFERGRSGLFWSYSRALAPCVRIVVARPM